MGRGFCHAAASSADARGGRNKKARPESRVISKIPNGLSHLLGPFGLCITLYLASPKSLFPSSSGWDLSRSITSCWTGSYITNRLSLSVFYLRCMPPRAQSKPKSTGGATAKASASNAAATSPEELEALKQSLIKRLVSTGEWNRSVRVEPPKLRDFAFNCTDRVASLLHILVGVSLALRGQNKVVGHLERQVG